jgi:sugar-specific transcriptional regulator TrmB
MKRKFSLPHINKLQELGLTKNQALLYLTSLQKGLLSALELGRLTKINRHQIYKDAERLIELGLYESTSKVRKKYIPADPSRLEKIELEAISKHKKILSDVVALTPFLENLSVGQRGKVSTIHYDGIEQISKGYKKELELSKNTEVLSFVGSIKNTFSFFPEKYWDRWNKQFVKQKSKSRMLVDSSEHKVSTIELDNKYNRETRFVTNFPLKVNIDVFNNVTYIVSFDDEIGFWIESPIVANSYKILFESLWNKSGELK